MKSFSLKSSGLLFLILTPIITFGIYIILNAFNLPYTDDEGLLIAANDILKPGSDIFEILLRQHNDHRIFFAKLAATLITLWNGQLDFKIMIICGYSTLLLLAHSLFLIFRSLDKRITYFIPIVILLFSPIVYGTQLWSLTAFEQNLAIAFSFYCLYFLQPDKEKIWYYSLPFAIAAPLANLDGLSVIPIAILWLIVQGRKKTLLLFVPFASLYFYLFFQGFHFSTAAKFPKFPELLSVVSLGLLFFTGSVVKLISDTHAYLITGLAGGIMLMTFAVITTLKFIRKKDTNNFIPEFSLVEISFIKILSCALMIAIGRAGDGFGNMFAVRFQIYAVCILALFYFLVLGQQAFLKFQRSILVFFGVTSSVLSILSYVKYDAEIKFHVEKLKADSYNFPNSHMLIHQHPTSMGPNYDYYNNFVFPHTFEKKVITDWTRQAASTQSPSTVDFKFGLTTTSPDFVESAYPIINFQLGHLPSNIPKKDVYLILFNAETISKNPLIIAVKHKTNNWLKEILNSDPGTLQANFPRKIPMKHCNVMLCWTENNINKSILVAQNFDFTQIGRLD